VRRWILVTSGKGGVGKSLVARLLAEMKREVEPATWLLDGDGEVGQLAQYLGTRDELAYNTGYSKSQVDGYVPIRQEVCSELERVRHDLRTRRSDVQALDRERVRFGC